MNFLKKIGTPNKCDIFIFIWGLYSLQGVLYSRGLINTLLQLLLIVWSIVAVIPYLKSKNRIVKSTLLLLFMFGIYGSIYLIAPSGYRDYNGVLFSRYQYLQNSLNSLLPIIMFYGYTLKGYLNHKRIVLYSFYFLVVYIFVYYGKQQELILESMDAGFDREEFTNNAAYNFVTIIPFALIWNQRPFIQYVYIMIAILFVILGMKRGAILLSAFSFIYFILSNYKSTNNKTNRRLIVVFTFILIICIFYCINYMINYSYYFMHRFELTLDGDSSGRDSLYLLIWEGIINESSILKILFGHGIYSTVVFSGHLAHQDWLEVLCNNGIIGVFVLANFFLSIFLVARASKKYLPQYMYRTLMLIFYISFFKTFFSMSIQELELSQTLLLGFLAANYQKARYN